MSARPAKTCYKCGAIRPSNWRAHNRRHGAHWLGVRIGNNKSIWTCCTNFNDLYNHAVADARAEEKQKGRLEV